jgi:ribose transport system substrate-binding protein
MKVAKRALVASAFSAAIITMTSCGANPHEPSEKYILVAANTKLPYWQTALAGLNRAASELKVKAEMDGPDTYDTKAEHDEFQRVVAQKPAGILISAADASLMTPDINAALAQGIPVLTMDSDAPDSKRLFFIGTDNYRAGTLGGKLAAKLLGGKGNIVVLTIPSQPNLKDRLHGFQDAISEQGGLKVVQVVDMKGDPTIAFDTAKQMLDGKNKPDAFVCLEAISCPEVGEVVNRQNMGGKVKVIAMDTDQRTIDLLQKGVISATIAQKPFTMGYYGAKLLADLHLSKPTSLTTNFMQDPKSPVPTFVDTGSFVVDKDNVATFIQENK